MLNRKVQVKRGRPVGKGNVSRFKPVVGTMAEFTYDKSLFTPMPTGKKVDKLFSSEGGLMKGTNYAFVGDPGVGKTTVLLDILADMQANGNKVLFISGEMNRIDMVGYVKRYPKFNDVPILFMGDYIEKDPVVVLTSVLAQGWDVVLIDSMAEVCVSIVDFHGGTMKNAETKVLNLLEKHNKAENQSKKNTTFMIIQQVTKTGNFAGSNRFKHMLTGMAEMRFQDGGRYISFSKNRRGGQMDKLFYSLDQSQNVGWLYTEAQNAE